MTSLASLGARLIVQSLDRLDTLTPIPQPVEGVTYAQKIDKAEARIDWTKPAALIDRQIRGLSPFPGAWCEIDGARVKLLNSELSTGTGEPGQHLGEFHIACGEGAVRVTEAQRQGKRPINAEDFLRGTPLPDMLT